MRTWLIISGLVIFLFVGTSYPMELSDIKIEELKKDKQPKWGRDPFVRYEDRFKVETAVKEEGLFMIKIGGVISNGKKAVAIINGEFYRKGDTVSGFKILDISGDKVLFERNGKKFLLGIDRFAIRGTQLQK
ncbi:MAG: hypothetical protein HY805_06955 [Nitrospirae bacterium]|nr:hypothetical protein [Nitrospirota bacterium]